MKRLMVSFSLFLLAWALATPSASAAILLYGGSLSGLQEAPVNNSQGSGLVFVTIDTTTNLMRVQANFTGLTGNTTAAHIHAATVVPGAGTSGVATTTPSFVGFPLGVTSGSMDQLYDMSLNSSYNAAYITANGGTALSAFGSLQSAIANGQAYFNIHTSSFAGGEVRTFLIANVPEPSSMLLLGGFIAGAGVRFYRRRNSAKSQA